VAVIPGASAVLIAGFAMWLLYLVPVLFGLAGCEVGL
jgi:hypothetical protein